MGETERSADWYWTEAWQDDERESLAALARGEGRRFESAEAAIAWLLDDDDESIVDAPSTSGED